LLFSGFPRLNHQPALKLKKNTHKSNFYAVLLCPLQFY
jgi:hypothetical protein